MGMFSWKIGALIFVFWVSICSGKGGQKSVIVSLDSKWPQTSLLLEAGEFLAKESNQDFWSFVQNIAGENEINIAELNNKELYEFLLKRVSKIVSPARTDLLKLALSLRAHSPTVEMFRQIALHSDATLTAASECATFVEVNGESSCKPEELETLLNSAQDRPAAEVYTVDHHYPGSNGNEPLVVLYANLADKRFLIWHDLLKMKAEKREIDYVLRPFVQRPPDKEVRLSGYGVELAIKSTEYKAQDDSKIRANVTQGGAVVEEEEEEDLNGFNFKALKDLHPDMKDSLQELKLHWLEVDELAPLKVWQLQDLSFQAAQRVVAAGKKEALSVLQDISQNFPLMARSLTRTPVKADFRKEVEKNQGDSLEDMGISPGESALFINGLLMDMDSLDIYQLLETLKREEKLSAGFFKMGFRREYLSLLMNLDLTDDQTSYALDHRPAYPEFLNNLDKDKQYKEWGNSVRLMLQPYFPGMIRPIARNFFTLVFLVDPASKEGMNLLKIAYSFFVHEIPIRTGMVFVTNPDRKVAGKDDPSVALLNLYNFVKGDKNSPSKGARALLDIYDEIQEEGRTPTTEDVVNYFKKKYPDEDDDLVFGEDSDYDTGRQAMATFLEESGLGKAPKVLLNGIPLDDSGITADRFEETVIGEIMKITPKIQKAITEGKLTDDMDVGEWVMDQPDVMPRLNQRVLGGNKETETKYLDFTDVMEYKAKTLKDFRKLSVAQQNAFMIKSMKYLKRTDEDAIRPVTLWVVADLETREGRELYYNAIKQLKHSHKIRLGLIHNPTNADLSTKETVITKLVEASLKHLSTNHAKMFVTKLVKEENVAGLKSKKRKIEDLEVGGMNSDQFKRDLANLSDGFLNIHSEYVTKVIGLKPGQRAVIANGQVVGPLDDNESFLTEDFGLLEKFVLAQSAQVISDQIKQWDVDNKKEKSSDVVMRVASLVLNDPIKKKRHWVVLQGDELSTVTIPASDETTAAFDVIAIVNPLSREAQKMAPLITALSAVINADLQLVMNPKAKLSEMPLKSFYRMVLDPELQFASDGSLRAAPYARFSALPQKQLLTLNVIPPEAWLVESVKALYDLDNIKMETAETDVVAEYELEYLLLEGHCFDEVTGNPPRGLQFTMGTQKNPVMKDTIVMANLGYFQMKASPGAWILRLREGRSAEIYDITTHHNTDSPFNSPEVSVVVDSFTGKIIRIRVAKKAEKINENLLSDGKEEEDGGLWKTISSKFATGATEDEDETLNIFSLASGHLYERFIRIMMLSVTKKSSKPVKFWLLKNYLSPSFKKFLPYMAEHFGFQFELVQYKWPRWLHQQTEKQRVMWGYKILFLDVLFPLDVKKVIFVDADQVVRTDLVDLIRFDLEGAPYGYTPFCDSRKEMDGFRFWKQGYWAQHLSGRRYHISALYVVDLKKFRQIAAGDRLRGQYQGLSADPNSLSNLDQDLPNNMIHQVRIKSLPQDWLWCETWCDERSKASAKTIDLCNNPQTKEPKLDSAMRIVPEWKDLDQEIRKVMDDYDSGLPVNTPLQYKRPTDTEKHVHDEGEL